MPNYISIEEAQQLLPNSKRVLVVGCSGGGKTTLSRQLSEKFDLTYQSIDRDVRWLPGWTMRDRVEQRDRISTLVQADRWVMDGSGASTFDLRLPRADLVLWVRVPRYFALCGLATRVFRNYGRVRVGMADGCPEALPDRAFLSYIWNFEAKQAPVFVKKLDEFAPELPVAVARSRMDMRGLTGTST